MNVFEYIEKLAEKHVDVRHVPGMEIHFLGSDNEKYTSIPSELNYPAVILDKASEFGFSGTRSEDGRAVFQVCQDPGSGYVTSWKNGYKR